MRWLKQCCCCCADERLSDSNSSLVQQSGANNKFCIPRRHSSYHHSEKREAAERSSSSSDDEEEHKRGRSWSTIPSTDSSDRTAKKSRSSSLSSTHYNKGAQFDRHVLTEIAESETADEEEEGEPKRDDVYGYLTFFTAYDERELRLRVFVEKASSLPKKSSPQEAYNTFVKMCIIFSNKNSLMTRTVKNTLSPIYKEDHIFHTNRSKWTSTNQTCLRLSVFDCERQGRHDAVGHALLPLSQLSGKKQRHVLPLTPMSIPTKNLGQILVGLSYVPTQSLLSVQVLKARHLTLDPDIHNKRIHNKDTLDTFAKVTLKCAGQKVKSNASRGMLGVDPFYNFKSSFVLPPQFMLDASLVVSVVVRGILGRGFTLGRVISGPYTELSDGTLSHWGKMDKRNIVQWRNLYL
ncbi:synaptotagmin-17-like [Parasteatoda tepidariorum]|uniref:synaptotagmin-17-like n=1 Tax=Parasteatoda tepidariorum TaxID=114398 RepID=UPI00077FDC30|nr:synaptotagmin-15-like [Parasteatoda tepidariorum]XP_015919240.1 synaptotagmin-15-like [Parasteatoda tepidariorum]XP_015919241.1 synaptotagmin-15-like [Parasteatoda tepidariorum]